MDDDLIFRRAEPIDAAAVRALTRAAYARWVPIIGREPRPMVADYDDAVRRHRIDILERTGAMLALVEMSLHPDHLLIVNVAVDPVQQGKGLGRVLLDHAEAVARAAALDELRLYTNRLMTENVALYQRRGYRIIMEEEFLPGSFAVHLSKRLDGAGLPS
jgi:ribosomal protein S18 acetylase RimI-like enzyme